jgi:hypothetical protein
MKGVRSWIFAIAVKNADTFSLTQAIENSATYGRLPTNQQMSANAKQLSEY